MPAAMHLTVLVFLVSVNVCTGTTTSSAAKPVKETNPATANPVAVTKKNDVTLPTSKPAKVTQRPPASTNQPTTALPLGNVSTTPTASAQTPNTTEGTQTRPPPQNATTNQTPNGTEGTQTRSPPQNATTNQTPNGTEGTQTRSPPQNATTNQTPNGTEGTQTRSPPQNATTNQTPNGTEGTQTRSPPQNATTNQMPNGTEGMQTRSPPQNATTNQTPNGTEGMQTRSPPQNATTNQKPNRTVSPQSTATPATASSNEMASTIVFTTGVNNTNTTDPGFSGEWNKGDLAANPGLVVILCLFCIIFALALVVTVIKCLQSPRSDFERLEDVPLSKVNEESPFAKYSK
ncbi:endochitinase A-like [Xyrichtys novacula]|uniref:Endochitinase A-like n=1 Tax=Xyrichtys novacula TaxID=13765 RepID=A0AAV1FIK9_XYRNO|nr:endochitinase A-like [Xyrichtys novacula]